MQRRGCLYGLHTIDEGDKVYFKGTNERPVVLVVSADSWNFADRRPNVAVIPRRSFNRAIDMDPTRPPILGGVRSPLGEGGSNCAADYDCWQILSGRKRSVKTQPPIIGDNLRRVEYLMNECLSRDISVDLRRRAAGTKQYRSVAFPRGSIGKYTDLDGHTRFCVVLSNETLQRHRAQIAVAHLDVAADDETDYTVIDARDGFSRAFWFMPETVRSIDPNEFHLAVTPELGSSQLSPLRTEAVVNEVRRHLVLNREIAS